jgi:pseudoazurin
MSHKTGIAAALAATLMFTAFAHAAEFEVKMLNKGAKGAMVFEPDFIKAAVGDSVKFVVVDKGHNAESIKGMLPEAAEPFKGKVNEEIVLTLTQEGVYGVKCLPHYGMGMVALIVAGNPVNLDTAKAVKNPGKAKTIFAGLFEQLEKGQ